MKNIKLFIIASLYLFSSSSIAFSAEPNECDLVLVNAIKEVETVSPDKRFVKTLNIINNLCEEHVSKKLRLAAVSSLSLPYLERQRNLQKAAASYFPRVCIDTKATALAKSLAHTCQEVDFKSKRFASSLLNVDAASYMYGKALEQELINSGTRKSHRHKIMLNYFLGAAFEYERQHAKAHSAIMGKGK